jgi:hypothetical protein
MLLLHVASRIAIETKDANKVNRQSLQFVIAICDEGDNMKPF